MKFIKQLNENQFVVELDKDDIDSAIPRVIVAHDYVEFVGRDWHCTDLRISGPHGSSNVVHNRAAVQIPIRVAQDMLRTVLKRNYMQPKHLKYSDGKLAYLNSGHWGTYRYYNDQGQEMVAIEDSKTGEFHHMSLAVFNSIRTTQLGGE